MSIGSGVALSSLSKLGVAIEERSPDATEFGAARVAFDDGSEEDSSCRFCILRQFSSSAIGVGGRPKLGQQKRQTERG